MTTPKRYPTSITWRRVDTEARLEVVARIEDRSKNKMVNIFVEEGLKRYEKENNIKRGEGGG